jgi:hypothetical protein
MSQAQQPKFTLATQTRGNDLPYGVSNLDLIADVKCFYCGHISGQVVRRRGQPLRVSDFIPRQGYTGVELQPGNRLRCERCCGPVFLEDVGPAASQRVDTEEALRRRLAAKRQPEAA